MYRTAVNRSEDEVHESATPALDKSLGRDGCASEEKEVKNSIESDARSFYFQE
jgi:hypothetical protein